LTEWLENNLDWDEIDYIREDNDSSDLEHYDEEGDDYGM
jgi:hypothetical protein